MPLITTGDYRAPVPNSANGFPRWWWLRQAGEPPGQQAAAADAGLDAVGCLAAELSSRYSGAYRTRDLEP
jgi:hypothetical protein